MHKVTESDSGGIFFVSAGETLYVGRGLIDGKLCLGSRSISYSICFTSRPYTFNTRVLHPSIGGVFVLKYMFSNVIYIFRRF